MPPLSPPTAGAFTTRRRAQPAGGNAAIMRVAADFYGSEALARDLRVAARSLYRWIAGTHPVPSDVLRRTRLLMIDRRQRIGMLIHIIRATENRS
jgi:hypothetical protein